MRRFISLLLLVIAIPTFAQDAPNDEVIIEPIVVTAIAEDGLTLQGDFYVIDLNRPTIILLHELYTTRRSWEPVIGPLLGAHFNVLAVDLRGYGRTRGAINWQQAIIDVQSWFNWLRLEGSVRGDAISVMGSSMGSSLAVAGCANDEHCRTVIAISPGARYFGVDILQPLAEQLPPRQALVIYSERDRYPRVGVPQMIEASLEGFLTVATYSGNAHGMNLIDRYFEEIMPQIIDWFGAHAG